MCLPIGRAQADNAARVACHGAGRRMNAAERLGANAHARSAMQ
jgi:hypothetical protein